MVVGRADRVQAVNEVGARDVTLLKVGRAVGFLAIATDNIQGLVRLVAGEAFLERATSTTASRLIVVGRVSTASVTAVPLVQIPESSLAVLGELLRTAGGRVVKLTAGLARVGIVAAAADGALAIRIARRGRRRRFGRCHDIAKVGSWAGFL